MIRRIFHSFIISSFCVMAIFAIHFVFPSMLNNSSTEYGNFSWQKISGHAFLTEVWQYHTTHEVFAGRPLTSWLIQAAHVGFDLSYNWSFVLINFGLLIFCGVILHELSALLGLERKERTWTLILFYTSFTILFGFFASIYSYDEPLQYLFIFLALIFLERKRWLLFSTSLFIALMARESTLLLFPSLFLHLLPALSTIPSLRRRGVPRRNGDGVVSPTTSRTPRNHPVTAVSAPPRPPSSSLSGEVGRASQGGDGRLRGAYKILFKSTVLLAIPALLSFIAVRAVLAHAGLLEKGVRYATHDRLEQWKFNFQSSQFTVESVVSFFLALIIPVAILLFYRKIYDFTKREKKYFFAFVLALIINTPIVFIFTHAREARLFAVPLVFLWPVLGKYFLGIVQAIKQGRGRQTVLRASMAIVAILLAYYFSFHIYHPTFSGNFDLGYQVYLFISISVIAILIAYVTQAFRPDSPELEGRQA